MMKVAAQPANKLGYTNHVYVHPECKLGPMVQIGGFVFIVTRHDQMAVDTVGLNLMQRTCIKANHNDQIDVKPWTGPDTPLSIVHFIVDTFPTKSLKVTLDEKLLNQHIRETYAGQVFTQNQSLFVQFDDNALCLTVKQLDASIADEKKIELKKVACGKLLDTTKMKISALVPKWVKLEEDNEIPNLFRPDWNFQEMGIGGLDDEFAAIFRRAFVSRMFPPREIEQLGIKHVKGMLLYGPPGTGKTLIARQITKMLNGREPKIVNGPEIMSPMVGVAEENIRKLFADAEEEWHEKKEKSSLHVIVFDEIDAICKKRGTRGGGTGVEDRIVNQLLSKIDGVNSPNNFLIIGMTNRKEMLDDALLRPGRLEVHAEIHLPDEQGRVQILNIHTRQMRDHKRLAEDVDIKKLATMAKNFSGAELEGLVKAASSFALYGCIDLKQQQQQQPVTVCMEHFEQAMNEITPAFGSEEDEFKSLIPSAGGLICFNDQYVEKITNARRWTTQLDKSKISRLTTVLVHGPPGVGKTAFAAHIAMQSGFPFIKLISPARCVGLSEMAKCSMIAQVFDDAYKSERAVVLIDDFENLIEYSPVGPRYNNNILQTIKVLLKRKPTNDTSKLLVLMTCSAYEFLNDLGIEKSFHANVGLGRLTTNDIHILLKTLLPNMQYDGWRFPIDKINFQQLLMVVDQLDADATLEQFVDVWNSCGF